MWYPILLTLSLIGMISRSRSCLRHDQNNTTDSNNNLLRWESESPYRYMNWIELLVNKYKARIVNIDYHSEFTNTPAIVSLKASRLNEKQVTDTFSRSLYELLSYASVHKTSIVFSLCQTNMASGFQGVRSIVIIIIIIQRVQETSSNIVLMSHGIERESTRLKMSLG